MLTLKTFDSELSKKNGQRVSIERKITEADETHDAEVLPMYAIVLEDGTEAEVWKDEITGW